MMRRSLCSAVVIVAVTTAAHAADAPPSPPWYQQSWIAVTGAARAVGLAAGLAWTSFDSLLIGSDPYEYLPNQISEDDQQFFAALDALGLQLSEIRVGGGTFYNSSYRFVASREPSDVDIERAQRKLAEYRATSSGLRAGAKQRIVQSVLDVAGEKDFVLSAATVELWPWPSVRYEITTRNRPPEVAERRAFVAAQQ